MIERGVIDTDATGHFGLATDPNMTDLRADHETIAVVSPNGGISSSTHKAKLTVPHVSAQARKAHIFSSLASGLLYSIGKLCNDGCIAVFAKEEF